MMMMMIYYRFGYNALHFAASNGMTSTCEWLATHGLHVTDTDGQGATPLHHAAAAYDGIATVKLLISLGASVTTCSTLPIGIGQQPLHAAAFRDREEIVW
jgi:ankyrin repeat protein